MIVGVPKEIKEPSRETEYATALSRSLRGAPPSTEIIQMLEPPDGPDLLGSVPCG